MDKHAKELREALSDLVCSPALDDENGCPCCDKGGTRFTDGGRTEQKMPHETWCPLAHAREVLKSLPKAF